MAGVKKYIGASATVFRNTDVKSCFWQTSSNQLKLRTWAYFGEENVVSPTANTQL